MNLNNYYGDPPEAPLHLALAKKDGTCAYCEGPIKAGDVIDIQPDAPPFCEACIESENPGEAQYFRHVNKSGG